MSQPKDFLYFLTDQTGKCYRKVNGLIEATSARVPLKQTPDGWQEKSIRYTRNTKAWGVFRSFTTPLKFVKDGAMIIRDRLIRKGTNEKLYLVLLWLDKTFGGGWIHRSFYKGEIDLSNVQSEEAFVTANIMEGDLMKFIKANENTAYEIKLNVPEAVIFQADAIPVNFTVKWGTIQEDVFTASMGSLESFFSQITMFEVPGENSNVYLTQFDVQSGKVTDFANSLLYPLQTTVQVSVRVRIALRFRLTQDNDCRDTSAKFQLRDDTGAVLKEFLVIDPPDGSFDQAYVYDIDETLVLPANKKFFLGFLLNCRRQTIGTGEAVLVCKMEETVINFEYTQRYKTEYKKALRPAYVAQQLLNKMTESTDYTFQSEYFTQVWENLCITSGNEARGIADSVIKTSWNDFFDSYNLPCNICYKVKGKTLIVEKKEEAFLPQIMANLGEAREFGWRVPNDLLFANFKIGYPNVDYENTNGKYEFNTTMSWVTPLKKSTKSFELLSKYRADSYGFTFAQLEGAGKDTTDLKSDNDVFFVHLEKLPTAGAGDQPAVFFKLLRKAYTSITGLLQPDYVWNLEISPKRCLLAHGNYLRSICYWETAESLTLSGALKDTALRTVDALGNVIEERAPVFIGSLASPLFIPIELKAEGKLNQQLIQQIDEEPNGTVTFSFEGKIFYGFTMDIGIQPTTKASQETIMLCTPSTNINQLIH